VGVPQPTVCLFVQFTSGDRYLYHDVPFGKAVAVALGDSCGKALNEQVKKSNYRFEKLTDPNGLLPDRTDVVPGV